MRIVADENIPLLEEFFGDIGEIVRVPGRDLQPRDVVDADILLVRSVTPVNEGLLSGSRVKFVGTATIGTDHIDREWLSKQGIQFASAPGCNASGVVEYVLVCLSLIAEQEGCPLADLSVGLVGAGNVGGELWHRLERLGMTVKVSDPPLEEQGGSGFSPLDEVLECDVVSLHTPLTLEAPYATRHLINAARLSQFRAGQTLINTSRGAVVDNQALLGRMHEEPGLRVVLDVWESEPDINPDLLAQVWLGTPHIAGYTLEGKMKGTEMIYQALCRYLGLPVRKKAGQFMLEPPLGKLSFTSQASPEYAMEIAMRACYDPRRDDAALRRTLGLPEATRAEAFDALRKHYGVRREFGSTKVQLKSGSSGLQPYFKVLGFKVKV
ncbi:4-phosphoerythronate dehydrogenase PdxB [Marinobacteraceae bacterium S3BR75-40.1]